MAQYSPSKRRFAPEVVASELRNDPGLRDFLEDLKQISLLSHADELALGRAALDPTQPASAEAARQKLVTHNLRLVVAIAKKYAGQGVPLADLIHEGTLGLIDGVAHYKPRDDTRFATYAGWWVEQACKHALTEQRSVVRMPYYLDDARFKVQRFITSYEMEHGAPPSDDEIVAGAGIRAWELPLVQRAHTETVSLDQMMATPDDADTDPMADALADPHVDVAAEVEAALDLAELYRTLRRTLTTRELLVLGYRYRLGGLSLPLGDLDDDVSLEAQRSAQYSGLMSLREIGLRLGLSTGTLSEIEQTALAKLRVVYGAQTDTVLAALQAA